MDKSLLTAFPFLAIFAPIFLFFGHIRVLIGKFFSLFIVKVEISGAASVAFNYYLQLHCKRFTLGEYKYNSIEDFSQVEKKRITVGLEEIGKTPQLIRLGRSFFLAQDKKGNDENGTWSSHKTTIYYLRGTFKHEKVLIEALDTYNSRTENSRFTVVFHTGEGKKSVIDRNRGPRGNYAGDDDAPNYEVYKANRILKYRREELGNVQPLASIMDGYVFCKPARKLIDESKRWFESATWYHEHGILWRRGVLIGGKPGSGKTSLVRKACQILDLPLHVFDLASMSNKEFLESWEDCQSNTPCAVLFDDIDKVFDKQQNIAGENGGGLTFETLLSALSGAQPAEGILVFCTANDMSKIDDTLAVSQNGVVSRPGRIDDIVLINDMDTESRTELANKLFAPNDPDIPSIVQAGEGMTAAQFNNYCSNLALDKWWANK